MVALETTACEEATACEATVALAMQDALATMQPTSTFGYTRHDGSPTACDDLPAYEDAWTGMALARVASKPQQSVEHDLIVLPQL